MFNLSVWARLDTAAAGCKNRSGLFIHEKPPCLFRPDDVSVGNDGDGAF